MDYIQYRVDLESINKVLLFFFQAKKKIFLFLNFNCCQNKLQPHWSIAYAARQEYDLLSLSPQSWSDLIDQIETNSTIRQRYLRFH